MATYLFILLFSQKNIITAFLLLSLLSFLDVELK